MQDFLSAPPALPRVSGWNPAVRLLGAVGSPENMTLFPALVG